MKTAPLKENEHEDWDAFCLASPDAWFWHTAQWMNYTRMYTAEKFVRNASFWIMEGKTRLGICPAILENRGGRMALAYSGEPFPAPAAEPSLSANKRRKVMDTGIAGLQTLAEKEGVDSFTLRIPAMAETILQANLPLANPLLRHGGLDMPFQTQLLDLRKEPSELWSDVRHGFQSDIRRAQKTLTAKTYDAETITEDVFKAYMSLHAKDAGRVTRSSDTFATMRRWITEGKAILIEIADTGTPVAFTIILTYKKGAFYASSCKDPDKARLPSMHLAQWHAIETLRARGTHYYDMGQQAFGPQWFFHPTRKDTNISLFKRGLGGTTAPLFTAEFHKDRETLRVALQRSIANCLSENPES